jgi:hypothetical protein
MTTKHTPGPWYVGSGTYEGRNIYSVASVTDDEGFTYQPIVASVEDDGIKCWSANARLIAAAPDLLRYLKEARRTLEMWKDVAPAVSLCADIDAAIARATGEQP